MHRNTFTSQIITPTKTILNNKCLSITLNVTGYWKTDHNVTLGQVHFIGPANSHTHALSMH